MASDDDDIFMDIVPQVDESALSKVSSQIKEAVADAGNVMSDVMASDFGQALKRELGDALEPYLDEIGEKVGDFLGRNLDGVLDKVDGKLKDVLGNDIGGKIGDSIRDGIGDLLSGDIGDIGSKVLDGWGSIKDAAGSLTEALNTLKSGDLDQIVTGLDGAADRLNDVLGNFGVQLPESINNAIGGAQDWVDGFKNVQSQVEDQVQNTTGAFKTLGDIGTGFGIKSAADMASGAAEAAAPIAGAYAAVGPVQRALTNMGVAKDDGIDWTHDFSHPWDVLGRLPGMGWTPFSHDRDILQRNKAAEAAQRQVWRDMIGASQLPSGTGADLGNAGLNMTVPALTRGMGAAGSAGALPSSITTSAATISARSAEISAVNVNINGGNINGHASASTGSGGAGSAGSGKSAPAGRGKSSGGDVLGSVGAIPHRDTGGVVPGSAPGYDNVLGMLPDGGMVGLEGGEGVINDAAMSQPGVPELVSQLNRHYAGGTTTKQGVGGGPETGGSGGPTPSNFSSSAGDTQHGQPQFRTPGTGNGASGDEDADRQSVFNIGGGSTPNIPAPSKQTPQSIIPTGKGKGFGVSGGIIGAAEGAAGGAASMFGGPGAGAAAQLAAQEANRAVGFLGQAATTLAVEAPLDTFWLSDSGLSDPSHSWFGKLGLSMVGEHLNSKNVAGATKAPLQSPADKAQTQGDGNQFPMVHIENQHNYSDVDHENNNRDLVTQLGSYANTPAPYTPTRSSSSKMFSGSMG